MLPDADDGPSGLLQRGVGLPIARAIPVEFRAPEVTVECWTGRMLGTAVPEAPVDEHRKTQPREDEVRGAPQLGQWTH